MKLVKQEVVGDCGPACIAMVLDCNLMTARELLTFNESGGVTTLAMVACLKGRGVPALESLEWPGYEVAAILTVPSLNNPGLLHYIIWDGKRYLDPSNEQLQYPQDTPTINGTKLDPCWSSAILLWKPRNNPLT